MKPGELSAALEPILAARGRGRAWVPRSSDELPSDPALADDVAGLLDAHPQGLSGSRLAADLKRRKRDVLDVLDSPRFVKAGSGPSSRWHNARGTGWEPIHGPAGASRDGSAPPEEIEAQEAAGVAA